MDEVEQAIRDLVIANRILANEDVVDAYGHVSIRHPRNPERYFVSCSRSPELVTRKDIVEFHLDGRPVDPKDDRHFYIERHIHGATYEARPDINAVVHSHAEAVLPYGIAPTPLKAVIHSGGFIGTSVPVWDIADKFGDTNLLVTNMEQGRDLARFMSERTRVVLMRGHGFAASGTTLHDVVRISVYLPKNARVQTIALQLGGAKGLSDGEIAQRMNMQSGASEALRAWEYWSTRAGFKDALAAPKPASRARSASKAKTSTRSKSTAKAKTAAKPKTKAAAKPKRTTRAKAAAKPRTAARRKAPARRKR